MLERVIENWLASVNERQYQIPFCQLLAAEGEKVIHISSHGVLEQGKDVISIGTNGVPRAYQLKCGRITLAQWRGFVGEIQELVEYGIDHPGVRSRRYHEPYLVTNGEINDSVLRAIVSANRSWSRRNFPVLKVITKGELLSRFTKLHRAYFPREPTDFHGFMELVLRNGSQPLQKARFAHFLESVLPLKAQRPPSQINIQRAIANAVVLASHVLHTADLRENYWAIFEGWTLTGSYVLATASKYKLAQKMWKRSFELCELGAVRALEGLCQECEKQLHFVEGDALTDGHFYRERMTLLVGLLSAWDLFLRVRGEPRPKAEFVRKFVEENFSRVCLWGESAVPFLLEAALEMESYGRSAAAEGLVASIIKDVTIANTAERGRGLPNPYYGPEDCVRLATGLDQDTREKFLGFSYTVESLIDFLTRRLRRQALSRLWEQITRISLVSFNPGTEWEWLTWKPTSGSLDTRLAARPQRWANLMQNVKELEVSSVPGLLRENPAFVIFFLLVFPQRFQRTLLKVAEDAIANSS